jgi:leucyl aminopeptidase
MQIRFADKRPTGEYALVLPLAGKDRSTLGALGPQKQTASSALDRQRFDGESGSASEQFIDENGSVRRLLMVGTGTGSGPKEAAE